MKCEFMSIPGFWEGTCWGGFAKSEGQGGVPQSVRKGTIREAWSRRVGMGLPLLEKD